MGQFPHSMVVVVISIMLAVGLSSAIAVEEYGCSAASTAQASPITLGTGISGSSSVSSTWDYGDVTVGAGLRFNEIADATVSALAPPAIDGSGVVSTTGTSATVVGLTTSNADDLIYVSVSIIGTDSVSSVTNSGTALTWSQRGALTDGSDERIETWWAIAPTADTRDITVSFASSNTFIVVAFGISGVNTDGPFDPNLGSPVTGSGSGTTQSVTLSTVNPNDLLIGAVAVKVPSGGAPAPSAGAGYTIIHSTTETTLGGAAEYKQVTSPQTSTTIDFSTSTSVTWAMIGDAVQGILPSVSSNTDLADPASSGSFTVAAGSSAFLWSPIYSSAATIYSGDWTLDLWASATSQGSMDVLFLVLSGDSVIALAASGSTEAIPTSKSEVISTFAAPEITVPSGDRLLAVLTNPTGSGITFTIYWGTGQVTYFETTSDYDYVLRFINSGLVDYSVSLSVYSYSSIGRIVSMTVYLYSPSTAEIVITDGAVTQSSGATMTRSASSTLYVQMQASANEHGSSSVVVYVSISLGTNPFSYYVMDITVS
ncbi:MAG: hypothetical protein OEM29_05825 [Thermoplasmata archaeon]|nr:hypothetical protein [Thermoplasmata archaeon]